MRCLHCNKKLSLLKLAKGDSFCSAQHFDAYQLQLSKSAYDRLISLPDEETPKAPLIFKEVPAEEMEADSALARLSAFRAPEKAAAPPPLAASIKAPPYAGFLAPPLPFFPPHEPVPASVPDASEPVAAPRDLAFPVHDVDATVCILNLYLRLGLSETPPRNWTRLRDAFAAPEAFPGAIEKPALAAEPCELPEVEELENPAAIEPGAQSPEPPVHIELIEVIPVPAPSAEPARPAALRLPFLVAPSFQERQDKASRFDEDASSAPRDWKLVPVLDHVQQPPRFSLGKLPQSTGFARNGFVEPKNAASAPVQSGFALPAAAAMLLPRNGPIESYPWQALGGSINLVRPPLEADHQATKTADYSVPVPAPVRPNAPLTPNIDRALILNDFAHKLLREALETRPRGQEPAFQAAPADALAVALTPIPASFPDWEGFSSRTWENETGRLSLPTPMPDAEARQFLKRPWLQSDVAQPPHPRPAPIGWAPAIHLLSPTTILGQPVLNLRAPLGNLFAQAFTLAAGADFGQSDWSAEVATRLRCAGDIRAGNKKIGLCTLSANWRPSQPAAQEVGLSKFLPVRRGAVLPSARAWPRLGGPPQ